MLGPGPLVISGRAARPGLPDVLGLPYRWTSRASSPGPMTTTPHRLAVSLAAVVMVPVVTSTPMSTRWSVTAPARSRTIGAPTEPA